MKDKNGIVIKAGDKVRNCATYANYINQVTFEVIDGGDGILFVDNVALTEYITGNNYTSLEIVWTDLQY